MACEVDNQQRLGVNDGAMPGFRSVSEACRRLDQARDILGLRAESHLQREIQRTQAAYQRLAYSGTLSANQQVRAYDKMQASIVRVRQEMTVTERQQRSWLKGGRSLGSGLVAGAKTLRQPLDRQRDYDAQLRTLANSAYRNNNLAVREAGLKILDRTIRNATRDGGGTPGAAMDALNSLLRLHPREKAFSLLPEVMKNATASGVAPAALVKLLSAAMNFNLDARDSRIALNGATTAAQNGLMAMPMLALAAPRALAAAKAAGFQGRRGYAQTLALLGIGDPLDGGAGDAAGAIPDLLTGLSASKLKKNAANLFRRGEGVAIQAQLTRDAQAGLTPLDSADRLIQRADSQDRQTSKLRAALANHPDAEKRAELEAAIDERHRAHIQTLLPERSSRSAYYHYERNRDRFRQLTAAVAGQFDTPAGQRTAEVNYSLLSKGSQFRFQQAENEKFYATNAALAPLSGVLGEVAAGGSRLAQAFPALASAVMLTSLSLTALGAATAKAGTGHLVAKAGGKLTRAVGGVLRGAVGKTGGLLKTLPRLMKLPLLKRLPLVGTGLMIWEGAQDFPLIQIQRRKDKKVAEARAKGLPPSPVFMQQPGLLDALDEIRSWLRGEAQTPKEETSAMAPAAAGTAPAVYVNVALDGRDIASAMETRFTRDGRRQ